MPLSLQEVQLLARKTPQVFGKGAAVDDCSALMRRGKLCSRGISRSARGNKRGARPLFFEV